MTPPVVGMGTIALDSVDTPTDSVDEVAGGSALYFGAAARLFGPVSLVGVVGEDFPQGPLDALADAGVDTAGISRHPGESFRWKVRYGADLSQRETLETNRGVTAGRIPTVPSHLRSPAALFLGSTDPSVQGAVLDAMEAPGLVVLDTMRHWIDQRREDVESLLARVDVLLVNEEESALLGGSKAPSLAAQAIREMGPTWVVVKRGAGGVGVFGAGGEVLVPARRAHRVVDPTGAGDAFAGGFVATLAASPSMGVTSVRRAAEAGILAAALAVTSFSLDGLMAATPAAVAPGRNA